MGSISSYGPDGRHRTGFGQPRVTGFRELAERVARRLELKIKRSGPLWWDPVAGVSRPIWELVNATPSDAELRQIEADYQACAAATKGVASARVAVRRETGGLAVLVLVNGRPAVTVDGSGLRVMGGYAP